MAATQQEPPIITRNQKLRREFYNSSRIMGPLRTIKPKHFWNPEYNRVKRPKFFQT